MSSLPTIPLVDGCLFIDNSGWMESLSTCHRLHQYKSLRRRIRTEEKPALSFGSALHTALEYRYVKAQNQRIEPWLDDDIGTILQAMFDAHPTPEGDWRTLNWAVEIFRRYNERYSIEDFNLLKYATPVACPYCTTSSSDPCKWCDSTRLRSVMVEMSFALPLFTWEGSIPGLPTSIPVYYSGKIDLPISIDGNIFILDHKTTSLLGSYFFDRMRMSAQQRGYCWAFQQLTGLPVSGYVVNAIRTKEPPQYITNDAAPTRRNTKQTAEGWWYDSLQRERYYLTKSDLVEWKDTAIERINEFFWHYQRGLLPMNTESCTKWGRCAYYDVCSLSSDDREQFLTSTSFSDNTWSPLKDPEAIKV